MKRVYFWFFAVLLFLGGCIGKDESAVTVTIGDTDDPSAPIIVFGFADALRADSLVGRVDTNQLVEFEPALNGKCIWLSPNTMAYYASEPLPPSSSFKAVFHESVLGGTDGVALPASVTFTTPSLAISGTMAWYGANSPASARQPVVRLDFNYPLTGAVIKEYIRFSAGGVNIPFMLLEEPVSKTATMVLTANLPSTSVTCELKAGAVSSAGGGALVESQEAMVAFPEPDQFGVVDVSTSFTAGEGIVRVITSEPPDANSLAGNVRVDPFVLYRAEATSNGFLLRGNFSEGTHYRITIMRQVKSVFGNSSDSDIEVDASFGSPAPSVAFSESEAFYLGSSGNRNLGLFLRNTKAINVKIFRVFENNLLHYLRNGKRWDWGEEDGIWYDVNEYPLDEDYGALIYQTTMLTNALPSNGSLRLLNLAENLFHRRGEPSGIYVVRVESAGKPWVRDARLISFSDIGLLSMLNRDELMVQAFSIKTAQPLEGVALSLVSRNNQEVVKGQTGAGGLWVVGDFSKVKGAFDPAMITARFNDDFNCMVLADNRVEVSRFDAGGRYLPEGPYDAFVYGERNLYRPGDSVHFAVIVRDHQWTAPASLPVILKVTDGSGRAFLTRQKKTGSNGEIGFSFLVPSAAMTGSWSLQVSSADEILLNRTNFLVEEFQPDRMSVQLTTQKQRYTLADKVDVTVAAASLIGPPAAGRRFELEYRLNQATPASGDFSDYNFGLSVPDLPAQQVITDEGTTGSDGRAVKKFDFPALEGTGFWRGTIIGTVFDENERPVIREAGFSLTTQKAYVGVNNPGNWVGVRAPHALKVATVDVDGKFLPDVNIEIDVARIAWETVIERQNGTARYKSQRREIHLTKQQLLVRGRDQQWTFTPPTSGEYQVRFRVAGTRLWVSEWFYAYGSGNTTSSSFGINREGEIKLQTDQASYKPGEKVKVLMQTPFDGVVSIITGQGTGKFNHQLVTTENRAASFDLMITEEMKPNVFVTATLIRKIDNTDLPLTVAHGLVNVNVKDDATILPLTITSTERSKARTVQTVVIQTKPGATVTLASVDEGILQLTNHVTPDPWEWFYGRRAFSAGWFDLYAKLYPELASRFSSSGGDGSVDMSRRVNPFGNKKAKPAVWWSGLKKADANGRCVMKVPLPAFSGKVRLMAVAFSNTAMASAQKFMVVADPVVITSGVPAFLCPGDRLTFPVTLMNTTSKPVKVKVDLLADGPIAITAGQSHTLTLEPNIQHRVMASLTATNAMGDASLTVKATNQGTVYREDFEFSVRSAAGPVRQSGSGVVAAGGHVTIQPEMALMGGSAFSQVWLTRNPIGEFAPLLNDLVQYPYGCLEQTTSAAFPQIYLMKAAETNGVAVDSEVAFNVKEAIRKISGMQRWDGAFTYWTGAANPDWWASAYATHFLIEAGKAGFDVNNRVLDQAIQWLHQQTTRYETVNYGYFDRSNQVSRQLQARRETAYSLFVLALAGKPNIPAINYYKENRSLLTTDSRVVLAAACQLAGDRSGYGLLMPGNADLPTPVRTDGESLYSHVSSIGWAMNALLTAVPNDQVVTQYLSVLLTALKSNGWMSTFDKSQALCALARTYGKTVGSSATATLKPANGKAVDFNGTDLMYKQKSMVFPVNISAKGKGSLYYSWTCEGIGQGPVESSDRVLVVRRTLLDRKGVPISGSVRPGDLVVVRIALQTNLPVRVNNVAVSDLLPACFEIENPRLAPGREYEWMVNRSEPEFIDVRHDRINLFTYATEDVRYFYYLARVTAAGEFSTGATSAEAMYNGQYYSIAAGNRITSEVR